MRGTKSPKWGKRRRIASSAQESDSQAGLMRCTQLQLVLFVVALLAGGGSAWKLQKWFLQSSRVGVRPAVASVLGGCLLSFASSAHGQEQFRLPPIDTSDPNRCQLTSSSIGQANAGRDKLFDLRECVLRGQTAEGKDLSGMIASNSDFSGISFKEAQISKAFAKNSKFIGCDFSNSVSDRVSFDGSDLSKSIFVNAVLSSSTFVDTNLQDTDFTDAYIGPFDLKTLCANPTLKGTNPVTNRDTKESAGCFE